MCCLFTAQSVVLINTQYPSFNCPHEVARIGAVGGTFIAMRSTKQPLTDFQMAANGSADYIEFKRYRLA